MNKMIRLPILTTLLVSLAAPLAKSDVFFTDDFSNGSTTNDVSIPGGTPAASSTSYDFASSKNSTASSIGPSLLKGVLTGATSSGYWEAQALFATNPVVLSSPGDYVEISIVFTNSAGTLLTGTHSPLWIGLYNSGAALGSINPPVAGDLANAGLNTTAGSSYALGNCADWQGYVGQVITGGGSAIITRPVQDGADTTSANQELCGNGGSGGTFKNPRGSSLASSTQTFTVDTTSAYTLDLSIMLDPGGSGNLVVSNALFSGVGTSGGILFSNATTTSTVLTKAFDGMAFGAWNHDGSYNPQMDISSITVSGHSTVVSAPPDILTQPVAVTVPNGGSCAFNVEAQGFNVTYQWYRYGTNLVDGGNISGSTSSQLIISPASSTDVASGANGYYVVVAGAGGYTTNSVTNSLTLGTAKNLVYSGFGAWDLNTSSSWKDSSGNGSYMFNYGDAVTFNDIGGGGLVNLVGSYLSASSVTVSHTSAFYTFQGSGSFAGPGKLIYNGSAQLTINNANTYTGGTIISNAAANLILGNLSGLGTGPVTLAKAGGKMEVKTSGGSTSGIQGDVDVQDDFMIQFDGTGAYAGVFLGNLSGKSGKTLTLNPSDITTTNRFRVYGSDTMCDANLALNPSGSTTAQANYDGTTLAPYTGGTQVYNGVISGMGGVVQRGGGTTILNGANTYSGGTTPTTGSIGLGNNSALGSGALVLAPELPHTTGSGTVFASGGARTIANTLLYPSGTNTLTLIVGGTNDITFTSAINLNGADGQGNPGERTMQIDNTGATTLAGIISDNSGNSIGFTKTGSGMLYLNGGNTYAGLTTDSAGTLAGSGSLAGSVVVSSGASIGGGASSAIGTLAVGGDLTIESGGGGFFRLNKGNAQTSDKVSVAGTLSGSGTGTITVTNLGSALSVGDTFTLFNKAVSGASSLVVVGGGVSWNNNLAVDGTIQVVPGVATNPTNIIYSVSGSTLSLSWPMDHTGWTLQVQTNSLATGLQPSGTWTDVPNSSTTNKMDMPVDSANGSVFYRLIYTP